MKPTEEQQAVIDCRPERGDVIEVKAFAGTGKTACLVMFANAHLDKKILYLAYNRAMREDAEKRFPANTTCKTTHQICWWDFGKKYMDAGKLGNMRKRQIADLMPPDVNAYPHKWENIKAIDQTLKNFMFSGDASITGAHIPAWVSQARRDSKTERRPKLGLDDDRIIACAESLWNMMVDLNNKEAAMPHDGYLKLFQLSGKKLDYDIILLDEAQDLNPATLEMAMSQRDHAGLVFVGDPYQQMYSFRGSRNAFNLITATETYKLTHSFRFGEESAALAGDILRSYQGEEDEIKGIGPDTEVRKARESLDDSGDITGLVIIARTNGMLIHRAIQAMNDGYTFGFCGGFNNDIYWKLKAISDLKAGRRVTDEFISLFPSYEELTEYATESEDYEMLWYIKLYSRYGADTLKLINEIKEEASPFESAEVKLITAHKSKGLEFDNVWLTEDFVPAETPEGRIMDTEEANILYVAVTRGSREVVLDKDLCDFLADDGVEYCRQPGLDR